MADLDTLRPEVISALDALYNYRFNNEGFDAACKAIRAELLRMAAENAQLRDVLADREMAAHANKEIAALKARIAEAQECGVVALCGGGASLSHEPYPSLVGKRVRLVVDSDD